MSLRLKMAGGAVVGKASMKAFGLFLNGLSLFGFDPRSTISSCKGLPFYVRDYLAFRKQTLDGSYDKTFPLGMPFPCLADRFAESGATKGTYFHQDLLVARRVFLNNPLQHVDVGSRIDGFVAHIAAFRKITVLDIRDLKSAIPNVEFDQVDMMGDLPERRAASTDSLSCLHAMEHFGLGRYGDPVRHDGYLLGIENLYRLLKPGGKLYFSVPIGPQRVEFNAHRVFSVQHVLDLFANRYRVDAFSYIDDQSAFFENAQLSPDSISRNFGCSRGCGIFEPTKL